ncbi:DJ-1/PfpI family protein [Methanolobus bombayensis]|uniref:DJ-1/PfpI family protein n=1 Tax=Methanolobus bombayensis TaxID=38023 RepID=UPI001AE6B80C|nr:DJ-1/PfpI family protein [Methanolobus bombayensis]MBP1908433.1 protease I [Methanolobus bombayensis]
MPGSDLDSKKVLMIVAQEDFRDEEFFEPREVFEDEGITITIASNTTDEATGVLGRSVKPDVAISKANVMDYDAIVISGGPGSRKRLWSDKDLQELVADAFEQEKVVAAICISPVVLARAGVLENKRATVFKDPESIKELEKGGAIYENESVIVTDNVVTGRDPASAEEFGEAVVEALGNM